MLLRLKASSTPSDTGFTLIEVLVVVLMVGILAAIAAPGWLGFVSQRRVNAANDVILSALQEAQSRAKSRKTDYNVQVETPGGETPRIAIYSGDTPTTWKSLSNEIGLSPGQVLLQTNLANENIAGTTASNTGTISFDYLGALPPLTNPDLDGNDDATDEGLIVRVAIPGENGNPIESSQRCVKVSTLLGSLKTEKGSQCNFP